MGSNDRILLIVIAAGIWILVFGNMFGATDNGMLVASENIATGVKTALNDCLVQRDGRFLCR